MRAPAKSRGYILAEMAFAAALIFLFLPALVKQISACGSLFQKTSNSFICRAHAENACQEYLESGAVPSPSIRKVSFNGRYFEIKTTVSSRRESQNLYLVTVSISPEKGSPYVLSFIKSLHAD